MEGHEKTAFVCPDDGIEREVFTPASLLRPFGKFFRVVRTEEISYEGRMFEKVYERCWLYCVLQRVG